jgi:hypothetical protein
LIERDRKLEKVLEQIADTEEQNSRSRTTIDSTAAELDDLLHSASSVNGAVCFAGPNGRGDQDFPALPGTVICARPETRSEK